MNKVKRKDKIQVSIDSLKIGGIGDPSGIDANRLLYAIQNGFIPEEKFFKSVNRLPLVKRIAPRSNQVINLGNGMVIGCSSTAAKGRLTSIVQDDFTAGTLYRMPVKNGWLQYEIGGISSYDADKIQDHDNVLKFFSFLRQAFSQLRVTELHLSLDIFKSYKDVALSTKNSRVLTHEYMNTTSFTYPGNKGIKAILYDKSIKEKLYLPVTRFEIAVSNTFLKNYLNGLDWGAEKNLKCLDSQLKLLAADLKKLVTEDFDLLDSDLHLNEADIYNQLKILFRHIYGYEPQSNNQYTSLMNLSREQENLWESSFKMKKLEDVLKKKGFDLLQHNLSLNEIVKNIGGSKATAHQINTFLQENREALVEDECKKTLQKISFQLAETLVSEVETLLKGDYREESIEVMTCTTLEHRNSMIQHSLATSNNPYISKDREGMSKREIQLANNVKMKLKKLLKIESWNKKRRLTDIENHVEYII